MLETGMSIFLDVLLWKCWQQVPGRQLCCGMWVFHSLCIFLSVVYGWVLLPTSNSPVSGYCPWTEENLASWAVSWVTYLCLRRSLSPLTRFCLVLVPQLVTVHACNSMWPGLLASDCVVVRTVTQSEQVNSTWREVQDVIISGLWRGCCHAACTSSCPSCFLPCSRMQLDRLQVSSWRAAWQVCMLIVCLVGQVVLSPTIWERHLLLWEIRWERQMHISQGQDHV